ncbi:MAG: hypothetical protein AAGA62_13640, partial [Bacteroidota bacterium]
TVDLQRVAISNAALYLKSDSSGVFNAGQLLELDNSGKKVSAINLNWDGLLVDLTELDIQYHHALGSKRMEALVHRLAAKVDRPSSDSLWLNGNIDLYFRGIAFNTDVGAYLQETPVGGQLEISLSPTAWTLSPTLLAVGEQEFTTSATFSRLPGAASYIYLENERTDYELSRRLLHDILQERLTKYAVSAPFPVTAKIITTLEENDDPEISTTFTLNGQDVRLLQNKFKDVHLSGTFVNRLSPARGGILGSRKNLFFSLDSVSGYREDVYITTPHAEIAVANNNPKLTAPIRLSGSAPAISKWLENDNFFFTDGRFSLDIGVNAYLDYYEELVSATDGQLRLSNVDVFYKPASASFPFEEIKLSKRADDVGFDLKSKSLPTGFSFEMFGTIDNLAPLLIEQPTGQLRTDVTLLAPHINWTDFLAFFGQNGYLQIEENQMESDSLEDPGITAMKTALVGIEETFHPTIEARFDSVGYYDVFTLTNF